MKSPRRSPAQLPRFITMAALGAVLVACGGSGDTSTDGGDDPGGGVAQGGSSGGKAQGGSSAGGSSAGGKAQGGSSQGGSSAGGSSAGGKAQGGEAAGGSSAGSSSAGGKAQGGSPSGGSPSGGSSAGGKAQGGGAQAGNSQGGSSQGGSSQGGSSQGGSSQGGSSQGGQGGEASGGTGQGGSATGGSSQGGAGGASLECAVDGDCAQSASGSSCCAGKCVDLATDTQNCGTCETVCNTAPNTTVACSAGLCTSTCDQGFNDCNGDSKDGCESSQACACTPGEQVACYEGPAGTENIGTCKGGLKTCNATGDGFGPCEGQVLPATEVCDGAQNDENCNGVVNEAGADPSCVCTPKSTKPCYGGPVGTRNVGACKDGVQTCNAEGTDYGPCEGDVQPSTETCAVGNDADEDCDGLTNEGGPDSQGCTCKPGEFVSCYEGNPADLTAPAGLCVAGAKSCNADGASFGPCNGQLLPKAETCDPAGIDEDCDGQVDEEGQGCECLPGQTQPCWDGPPGAVFGGNSICVMGTQGCNSGKWGACEGQVLPSSEPVNICTPNIDENCDGDPIGTAGLDQDGDGWSVCQGDCCDTIADCTEPKLVNPGAFDVAGNNLDDDCDGTPDNAVTSCDGGLSSNSGNALDYAKAIDLCQTTTENPADPSQKKWGVISAQLLLADGTGSPAAGSRSIRGGFGTVVKPKQGSSFAVLSTGRAADSNDTNPNFASFQHGQDMGTASSFPADWLQANAGKLPNAPGCPNIDNTGTANDPVMLKLRIRVPTNAQSFSFNSYFLSAEFPEWVCSPFNDFFVTLLDSGFTGQPANPADKNLAFYDPPPAGGSVYPVGVNLAYLNNGLFRACKNGTMACAPQSPASKQISTCTLGNELAGTGFDPNAPANGLYLERCSGGDQIGGGTGYLQSSGNVKPGEVIEIRFAVWDTSDHLWDSVVMLDNWLWSLTAAQPGTVIQLSPQAAPSQGRPHGWPCSFEDAPSSIPASSAFLI